MNITTYSSGTREHTQEIFSGGSESFAQAVGVSGSASGVLSSVNVSKLTCHGTRARRSPPGILAPALTINGASLIEKRYAHVDVDARCHRPVQQPFLVYVPILSVCDNCKLGCDWHLKPVALPCPKMQAGAQVQKRNLPCLSSIRALENLGITVAFSHIVQGQPTTLARWRSVNRSSSTIGQCRLIDSVDSFFILQLTES